MVFKAGSDMSRVSLLTPTSSNRDLKNWNSEFSSGSTTFRSDYISE